MSSLLIQSITALRALGKTDHMSDITAAALTYLTIITICWLLYKLNNRILPMQFVHYGQDFITTLAYCAFPYGHGILRKYHSQSTYFIFATPIHTIAAMLFPEGEANPVAGWISLLGMGASAKKIALTTLVQLVAAKTGYLLGIAVFQSDIHKHFTETVSAHNSGHCMGGINSSIFVGFLAESIGVCVDSIVRSYKLSKFRPLDIFLKNCSTSMLVVVGFPLTGMWMNPVMAFGHKFGCGKTRHVEHLLVYWIGPFLGAMLANKIIPNLHTKRLEKFI